MLGYKRARERFTAIRSRFLRINTAEKSTLLCFPSHRVYARARAQELECFLRLWSANERERAIEREREKRCEYLSSAQQHSTLQMQVMTRSTTATTKSPWMKWLVMSLCCCCYCWCCYFFSFCATCSSLLTILAFAVGRACANKYTHTSHILFQEINDHLRIAFRCSRMISRHWKKYEFHWNIAENRLTNGNHCCCFVPHQKITPKNIIQFAFTRCIG